MTKNFTFIIFYSFKIKNYLFNLFFWGWLHGLLDDLLEEKIVLEKFKFEIVQNKSESYFGQTQVRLQSVTLENSRVRVEFEESSVVLQWVSLQHSSLGCLNFSLEHTLYFISSQ